MAKKRSFKRALIMAILSMVVCLSMFAGTTFAWFTDSVTSSNNIIKAGNLDVELYYQAQGQTTWGKVTDDTNVFTSTLWEPGHTEVIKLKVANEGSLALKYQLGVHVAHEVGSINKYDKAFNLSDFIKYGIVEGEQTYANRDEAIEAVEASATALNAEYNSGTVKLLKTEEKIVTMVVYMPTTVGDEANAKTGENVPTINLGLDLFATQVDAEFDSFDDKYDENAPYPVSITVSKNVTTDSSNQLTEAVNITYANTASAISNVEVVVPEGAQIKDGETQLSLKIEEKDEVDEGVAVQMNSNQTATTYEISLEGIDVNNDKEIEVALFIEKGLIDVALYHDDVVIPSTYVAETGKLTFSTKGFSPFTVVSTAKVFASGDGTVENPYIINEPSDLLNISKYYHEYKYYKVADGVEALDLTGIGEISLYGSFDGNGVKISNLTTCLFVCVGKPDEAKEIKISNMDVTVNTTNGRALVRNIYNPGETIFENVSMHGYIEGSYNMGSFYNYGTANHGSSDGSDYTVSFINAKSDVTLVCTTGNAIGGMLGHGYEGANYTLSINMDENSSYSGKMYTTGTATCYQVMAMCSHSTYVFNGAEVSRYEKTYPSTKLTVATPTKGEDGYYVAPVDGVDHYVVYLNAQITAYDNNGVKIDNLAGMTGILGSNTITTGFDNKIFDSFNSAKIVNGNDHEYGYELKDGALTVYSGRTQNYASGWITLQVNQYDAEGVLLATGNLRVYEINEVATENKLIEAIANGKSVVLTSDIALTNNIEIKTGSIVTLNLNKHKLSYANTEAKASCAINNLGELTIMDGTVTYQGVGDTSYGYGTNTINNSGKLVIDGATLINTTAVGSSNVIDNAAGASLIVNDATITAELIAIRVRDGANATINSGVVSGKRAAQVHLIHNNKQATSLIINGGTFNGNGDQAIYSYAYGGCSHANTTITIAGGVFNGNVSFGGGNKNDIETVSVTGGTFNGDLGRYLANDGWEDIAKPQ